MAYPTSGAAASSLAESQRLREQHERLQLALSANAMGTWEMNLVTSQRTWSDETCALHGIKAADVKGSSVELTDDLMHPLDRKRLPALHKALREGQDSYDFEYRTTWQNKTHWIAARGTVLERSPEGPTRVVGVSWDITFLKEAEAARLAAEERLRLATEAAGMFAWEIDLVRGKMEWAENTAQVIGCEASQITDDPADGNFFVLAEDRPKIMNEFEAAQGRGDTYALEFRGGNPLGDHAFWQVNGKFIRGASGRVERAVGVTQNITRQKRDEQALRLVAERLAAAEAAAGALNYDIDIAAGTVWRSAGLTRILGWAPEEIPATPDGWTALKHPEDGKISSLLHYEPFVGPDGRYSLEYRVRHKDGHYVWVLDSGQEFRDAGGALTRYVGSTIDITARKRSEQALRRQASLIELSFEPIFVWHPERGIVEWNRGAEQLYGFTREEALGRQSHMLLKSIHPIPLDEIMAQLRRGGSWTGEVRHHAKEGRAIYLESRHQAIESDGELLVLETNHNVTERKRADAETARMAAIASASQDALFGLTPDGTIEAWNPAAERLFGYTADEIVGQKVSVLADEEHRAEQERLLESLRVGESVGPLDTVRLRKNGTGFNASLSLAPVKAADGKVIGMSAAVHDISDRKEWEARQILMSRELAHRVKNSFAVLQSILRSTLKAARDPKQFAEAFSGRLHSLAAAHDILTANDWKGAELGALAQAQLGFYRESLPGRLAISGPLVNLPAHYAVPFGLILNELATNALKHGALSAPDGTVTLSWRIEPAAEQGRRLSVAWTETGGPDAAVRGPDGFGSTLIHKSLPDAKVIRVFGPDGLVCTVEALLGGS
jgi:PAS domain S-box-containing protein